MRRFFTSLVLLSLSACGGSDENHTPNPNVEPPGGNDADGSVPPPPPVSPGDAGADDGSRPAPNDSASPDPVTPEEIPPIPPPEFPTDGFSNEDATVDNELDPTVSDPTHLIDTDATLLGVTNDDRIVYRDSNGLWSIKAAPEAPARLAATVSGNVFIRGRTVFNFTNVDWETQQGTLAFWTPNVGRRTVGTALYGDNAVSARADGKYVVFAVAQTDDTVDVIGARSDLDEPQVLVRAARGNEETCPPNYGFAGKSIIVTWCEEGSTAATLDRFRLSDDGLWKKETIASGVQPQWASDRTGKVLFYIEEGGKGFLLDGSEKQAFENGVTWGKLHPEGTAILYGVGDQLRRRDLPGSPIPIVTTGFVQAARWSDDLDYVLYSRKLDYEEGMRQDLLLTATDWFNPEPTVLVKEPKAVLTRSGFTKSSTHALYMTDVVNGEGTLHVYPVSGGEETTFPNVVSALAGPDNLIVFSDDRTPLGTWPRLANLKLYDVSGEEDPVMLRASVVDGQDFQLTQDRTIVAYVLPGPGAPDQPRGIYLHPLPTEEPEEPEQP